MSSLISRSALLILAIFLWTIPPVPASAADTGLSLVPWPKSVQLAQGRLDFNPDSRIVASDPKLAPLAEILAGEIYRVSGVLLKTANGAAKPGDISIAFDNSLTGEAYHLNVGDTAAITAGDYRATSWGTITLLQALSVDNGKISLPKMEISDDSDMKLRSAETDIARRWCPIVNLYELIDLFQYYKINYIQLHMNDDHQSLFTFKSELFPQLGTPSHCYSKQELKDLVAYADARGVTIIPEIEMPGHSNAPHILPKIFGSNIGGTGEYPSRGQGPVDIDRDDTVEACAALLNEVMDVFQSSPYISIGADEVTGRSLTGMYEYPEFQKNHPGEDPLTHFIAAMDDTAKKRGKTLMVFGRGGPDDVLQMPWVGNDNEIATTKPGHPGYMILPYSSGSVTHYLTENYAPPYNTSLLYSGFEAGYTFDLLKNNKISSENQKKVVGIQILCWQNWHFVFFPDYRKTMASVAENAWNYSNHDHFKPFNQWRDTMWTPNDARLDDLVFPVKFETQGLLSPGKDIVFNQSMTVKLTSARPGTIHYNMEPLNYFEPPALPTMESPVYHDPITLTKPTVIYARLFDESGQPVGYGTERRYFPIVPKVQCEAYSISAIHEAMDLGADGPRVPKAKNAPIPPLPIDPPELQKLNIKPLYTFPLGRMTYNPSYDGVTKEGFMLDMKGQIQIPTAGDYTFKLYGTYASLSIDGKVVATVDAVRGRRPATSASTTKPQEKVQLTAGPHTFEFLADAQVISPSVVDFQGPGQTAPTPLDNLIVPLPEK